MLNEKPSNPVPFLQGTLSETAKKNICLRVSVGHGMSYEDARLALDELLLLLSACVKFEEAVFRPSKTLDIFWHEFILHTQDYISFCQSLGVNYIHHIPDPVGAPKVVADSGKDVRDFLTKFGIPYDMSLWTDLGADCGCDKAVERHTAVQQN